MTKQDVINLAEANNETIDFARPMSFDSSARNLGIEPQDFVWHYNTSGGPKHIGDFLFQAIKKGNLMPTSLIPQIIKMHEQGFELDAIKAGVKAYCETF